MSSKLLLRGITWNHSRALPPLVATAQRFEEMHPGVEIRWEKRSLHDFGHSDLVSLAHQYDLLVIDHPAMGDSHELHALLDLKKSLDRSFLEELASDSCGRSYESYCYEGTLFALPIDAAAPAASFRPDLLERAHAEVPATWEGLLKLARKKLVVMPGFHVDVFLTLMGMCVSRGAEVALSSEELVDARIGQECLETLRELASYMPAEIYDWNPIALYECMAAGNRYAYCPLAFSYNNYSRAGFAKNLLLFANPVLLSEGHPFRTILGGTGMAISARCKAVDSALEYLTQVAGADWQRTLYALSGGQPAAASAWRDEVLNRITHGFFERTFASVEMACIRPRYPGYVRFQAGAGVPIVQYLRRGGSAARALEQVNALYRQSRKAAVAEHSL